LYAIKLERIERELEAALDAQPQGDEKGWLIERWGLCLGVCDYNFKWVTFTDEHALHFVRKRDAEAFIATCNPDDLMPLLKGSQVTEHLWCATAPAAPTVPPAVLDSTAWSEDFRAGYAKAASDFYHRGFSEGAKYEQARLRAAPPADPWKQKAREWLEHEQKRMPGGPCSYFGVETVIDMLARFAAAPGEKGSKS
jgi:hypothetical protein